MKRLSMFLIFASSLWADGFFPIEICPGEVVTINLTFVNPMRSDDPYPGDYAIRFPGVSALSPVKITLW